VKIKLDENLGTLGRDILVASGQDVMTIEQQGLSGADDNAVYQVVRDEGRVLVTLDHDFGQTLKFPPEATTGIAILECSGRLSPTMIRSRVRELATMLANQPIDGALWIVEPGRVRIRQRR
jgi:predicted nuclease of predicted toxin-antitoxin system